ncbi:MAG: GTP-binding protein [Candidatus Lokiarchaeota archaeon]|nr:GTP-binding protein [Candidatus Lokiarchaeota archaeon]
MVDTKRLKALLDWYAAVCDDIVAIVIADRHGLLMASKIKDSSIDDSTVGGLSAMVEPVLKRISTEFQSTGFGASVIDVDDYRLMFIEAGPHALLITITDLLASIDDVFPYAYIASEKAARIFDGRPTSPVIPKIPKRGCIDLGQSKEDIKQLEAQGIYAYKIILGGDGEVGKTSLIQTFIQGQFQSDYKATIGTSIMKKECEFENLEATVRFVIWDLAGQKQFTRVRQQYLLDAKGGFLVFDVTRKETFENIKRWHKETLKGAGENVVLMLIGNKIDLVDKRQVTKEEGEALAKDLDVPYFETSALNKDIVEEGFNLLAFQLIQDKISVKKKE